jgi:hypothetical protein
LLAHGQTSIFRHWALERELIEVSGVECLLIRLLKRE